MKFLANENIPMKSLKILREKNIDIIHINEIKSGISDIDVLKIALKEKRIILTFDKDYGELIFKQNIIPKGLIYFKFIPLYPEETAVIFLEALKLNIEFSNYFTVIERNKIRQRVLFNVKD